MPVLREELVQSWRQAGFCLVDNLFKPQEIRMLEQKLAELLFNADTEIKGQGGFGSGGKCEFPSLCEELNEACLHERILGAVSELLGTEDFRLTQGDAWGKVGKATQKEKKDYFSNTEQRMHMDFPNHDLAHPPKWDSPDTVSVLLYLTDSNSCGGETGIVPRNGDNDELYKYPYTQMPGFGTIPWINDKALAEEYIRTHESPEVQKFRQKLYQREKLIKFNKGSVLFYRHDVWHRGRPILLNHQRVVCNMVFKKAATDRVNAWNPGFARWFYNIKEILADPTTRPKIGVFESYFVNLSPLQRSVLGFPKPGDQYWTASTLEACRQRWGVLGMDVDVYAKEVESKDDEVVALEKEISSLQEKLETLRKTKRPTARL